MHRGIGSKTISSYALRKTFLTFYIVRFTTVRARCTCFATSVTSRGNFGLRQMYLRRRRLRAAGLIEGDVRLIPFLLIRSSAEPQTRSPHALRKTRSSLIQFFSPLSRPASPVSRCSPLICPLYRRHGKALVTARPRRPRSTDVAKAGNRLF